MRKLSVWLSLPIEWGRVPGVNRLLVGLGTGARLVLPERAPRSSCWWSGGLPPLWFFLKVRPASPGTSSGYNALSRPSFSTLYRSPQEDSDRVPGDQTSDDVGNQGLIGGVAHLRRAQRGRLVSPGPRWCVKRRLSQGRGKLSGRPMPGAGRPRTGEAALHEQSVGSDRGVWLLCDMK